MSDDLVERIRSGLQCAMNYARGTGTDYDEATGDAWVALEELEAKLAEVVEALEFYGADCDSDLGKYCTHECDLCCQPARLTLEKIRGGT